MSFGPITYIAEKLSRNFPVALATVGSLQWYELNKKEPVGKRQVQIFHDLEHRF